MIRFWACLLGVISFAFVVQAQTISYPVLVIDTENLYQTTEFSRQLRGELLEEQIALSVENKRLAEELRAEELNLTTLRKTLSPTEFAIRADAFDKRVQDIRRTQEEKTRYAETALSQQRVLFLQKIRPIIAQITAERGASLVLEKNSGIFMHFNVLDITQIAHERIDSELADVTP